MDIKGFLRHVCWQPQPSILFPAVLGSCPESFHQVPQKVHQPQISITHLVFVGSIPTVRDPGPGEQYL